MIGSAGPLHNRRQFRWPCTVGGKTVKTHVRSILAKLGVKDRLQAVIMAYETGFIQARKGTSPTLAG